MDTPTNEQWRLLMVTLAETHEALAQGFRKFAEAFDAPRTNISPLGFDDPMIVTDFIGVPEPSLGARLVELLKTRGPMCSATAAAHLGLHSGHQIRETISNTPEIKRYSKILYVGELRVTSRWSSLTAMLIARRVQVDGEAGTLVTDIATDLGISARQIKAEAYASTGMFIRDKKVILR